MGSILRALCLAAVGFVLVACGDASKQDIVNKAKGIETRDALERALGKPDDFSKMGPIEKWTYKASDGTVTFVITGDSVALQATGGNNSQSSGY